jgi:uncharacterized damage-inducible protein DinB
MIDRAYVQRMARYNRWQNENLYGVADRLPDEERRRERGAFFGSIHKTLSHLLWGDRIWMSRLKIARVGFDRTILDWADTIDPSWLAADHVYYSGATEREVTKPRWVLVSHMFNHQTHHRGQVHCLLTQAGGRPHDTDLPFMPE